MKNAKRWLALLLCGMLLCAACTAALAEDELDIMGGMTLKTFVKKFGTSLKITYAEYRNDEVKKNRVRYNKIKPDPVYATENGRDTVTFAIGDVNFFAATFEGSDIMESVSMEYEKGEFISSPDPEGESFLPLIMSILSTSEQLAEDLKDPLWASLRMLTKAMYISFLLPSAPAEAGNGEGEPAAADYWVKLEKADAPDRYILTFVYVGDDR